MKPFNWALSSYNAAAWTELTTGTGVVQTIIAANTTAAAITVAVRLARNDGTTRAVLVPALEVAANSSQVLNINRLSLGKGDVLQVKATAVGANFVASGELE